MSDCEIVRTYDEKVVLSLTRREAVALTWALDTALAGEAFEDAAIPGELELVQGILDDIEETIDGLEHGQEDDEDESNQN